MIRVNFEGKKTFTRPPYAKILFIYIFFCSKSAGRDGRSIALQYENRAPDLIKLEFMKRLRNNRARKHNEVKFEPLDVLSPLNNTRSVIKFGLN